LAILKDLRVDWDGITSLAPDSSPLVLREVDIQEIYAVDWEAL
jgi:hypothetical protein